MGLSPSDIDAAIGVLAIFKVQYQELITGYNQMNTKDANAFVQDRDALVQLTRDALKIALTPQGMSDLHAHIQAEKKFMTVAKEAQ